ncbi:MULTISPECIES: DUF3958 family protein [Enterococcus]|uniref:DUF3958 family protein n=2 Tax=Enterococcus TaxID=1350 RepID=UPI0003C53461|nr:DUF3958 family protein [Enterococcus mundtii]MBE9912268.1 DUF3958 family protein [Enterococcus mundtii]MRI72643.1 hypothetical protein [Enterococcus mundtii]QCJ56544.1 hypothetical protein DDJ96_07980 [Enterococcus mundtii]UBM06690.1 DUF3958 family protein [Enterococcus mundtii]UBM06837.1 DUF3958 family protein [Enterococcus mundtii]
MKRMTDLHTEETCLLVKRENHERKMKQLDACRSDYQNHFKEIGNFLFRLQMSYQKSNTFTSIETFTSEFSHQSRRLMNGFDECQHHEMIQQQRITNKLEEIAFEKRKIMSEEQNL